MPAEHMFNVGRFVIPQSVIEDNPDVVLKIMATVIVTKADTDWNKLHQIQYVAISPEFTPIEEGDEIPSYDINYDPETEVVTWVKE